MIGSVSFMQRINWIIITLIIFVNNLESIVDNEKA